MTKIKVSKTNLIDSAQKAVSKIENYKNEIINASVSLTDIQTELKGQGYESLLEQISKKLENQKTLASECKLLLDEVKKYSKAMADAEENAQFPT